MIAFRAVLQTRHRDDNPLGRQLSTKKSSGALASLHMQHLCISIPQKQNR